MKVAIVYDYLPALGGGAERVLVELAKHFKPEVHLYFGFVVSSPFSKTYIKRLRNEFGAANIHLGPTIRFLPQITFRIYNFLLPSLLQSINFQQYDLVVSYTSFLSHSIVPPVNGKHLLYMNTPARFLWNLSHSQSLLKQVTSIFRITDTMRFRSQLYDLDGINHLKSILVISRAAQERVRAFYNKDSQILYPASVPDELLTTDFQDEAVRLELGNYFTHVSRIESYKNIDLLLDTVFSKKLTDNIVIMGDGPYLSDIRRTLKRMFGVPQKVHLKSISHQGEKYGHVLVTGYIGETEKMKVLANASASFSLNDEDFGITKIESLAVGTPVIGLAAGATPEIITAANGVLFSKPTIDALSTAITEHKQKRYDRTYIIESAKKFTLSAFHTNLDKLLHA
jgi:glycosyltransferase involved in cell wall biosynthesis